MARLTATFSGPPTADTIRELDQQRLLADPILADEPNDDDLAMGRRLLEGASAEKIAAALVRAYRARLPEPEDVTDPGVAERPRRESRERDSGRDLGTDAGAPRERGYDRNAPQGNGGIWFRLDIGRKKNADPKWLLPMLCKRGGISKRDIGAIRIFDRESKVEIMPRAAEAFAAAIAGPAPAGENIAIERTTAPGGISADGPRPKAKPGFKPQMKNASDRGERPRRRESV